MQSDICILCSFVLAVAIPLMWLYEITYHGQCCETVF